jgi:hypothetical protein
MGLCTIEFSLSLCALKWTRNWSMALTYRKRIEGVGIKWYLIYLWYLLRPSYIRGLVEHVESIRAFEVLTTVYSFGICSYDLTSQAWVSIISVRPMPSRQKHACSLADFINYIRYRTQPPSSSFVELICFVRGTQSRAQAFTMPKKILRAN